jgi:phosphoserine phosphatase
VNLAHDGDSTVKLKVALLCVTLGAGLLVQACAASIDWSKRLPAMRALGADDAVRRTLADLDATQDGSVDGEDGVVFQTLASLAQAELARRGKESDISTGLYNGPKEGAPAPLDAARIVGQDLDLKGLDDVQLKAVAIEAHWRGLQARMASLAGPVAAGQEPFGGVLVRLFPGYNADKVEPKILCESFGTLDVKPLVTAGLDPEAVFDFDSTVVDGNIMDPFLAVLIERKLIRDEANPKIQEYLVKLEGVDGELVQKNGAVDNAAMLLARWADTKLAPAARPNAKDMFYLIVAMMRGMTLAEGASAAEAAYTKGGGIYPPYERMVYADQSGCGMRRVIALLKERGVQPYLLSATFDVLATESAKQVGIPREQALGSILAVKDGRYTGEVADSTYYAKGAITRQWLKAPPLFAFGDSVRSDFTMVAEAAAVGFMIHSRPDFVARDDKETGGRLVGVDYNATEAALAGER